MVRIFIVGVALAMIAQAEPPQSEPAAMLSAAVAKLQAQDSAAAAAIAERVVQADPGNARAWRLLGTAYHQMKRYDAAIQANRKALDLDPSNPVAPYNIGVEYALAGDKDSAFTWLARAKASRRIDMTQLQNDDDAASLRADPRFASLLPSPEDFREPFVENVRVIREWDGEAAGDQFGWIARRLGDVDGDRVPDIVTSAPTAKSKSGGEHAGRVYVYSTRTGTLLWSADGAAANNQLGSGVEAAGDTNHDGIPDVIASAPGGDYAKVYSGRDGRVLLTLDGEKKGDSFGVHAAGVGDVNRDGYDDVIVGAPGAGVGGRAYVFSGRDGHLLLTLDGERAGDRFGNAVAGYTDAKRVFLIVGAPRAGTAHTGRAYVYDTLSATPQFMIDADETGTALGGMFLSVPGDMDGDGVPDVYVSDWRNNANGASSGRVYVHSGKNGHRLLTLSGETAGDGFGTSPSVAGDVDADGVADLIVGAWQYSGAAMGAGRAYLYSGKSGAVIKTYTCRTPGDAFGFDAVSLGDVGGDGDVDFLITAAWSGVHGFHSGRIFVISSGVR